MFVRAFYPVLVRLNKAIRTKSAIWNVWNAAAIGHLHTLAAPFCAVGLLTASGLKDDSQKIWMGALAGIGFLSSLLSFKILKEIRADIPRLKWPSIPAGMRRRLVRIRPIRFQPRRGKRRNLLRLARKRYNTGGPFGYGIVGVAMKLRELGLVSCSLAAAAILNFLINESLAQMAGPVVSGAVCRARCS